VLPVLPEGKALAENYHAIIQKAQSAYNFHQDGFTLDYRDWPALIKDVDRSATVYPAP
jgi:hypothetical protein